MTSENSKRLIVLEFNELCPPLLEKLMAKGALPNFQRLHDQSEVYVSTTNDKSLEPWVQWVSYHTARPQSEHGINELDQGHCITLPQLWDHFAEAGSDTLVFGAMNAGPSRSQRLTIVPDPWSRHVAPSDKEFAVFHDFVSHNVAEHTNPDAQSGARQALAFGRFLMSHGLSLATLGRAVTQVLLEKIGRRDRRWHRATILDLLSWDVFKHTLRKRQPQVAFFFANSVAFYQHRFWRHMAADDYANRPAPSEMAAYGNAIETGYRALDSLVGEALDIAGDSGSVVLVTALSQEANLKYEDIGGKFVHRPRDFQKLFTWLGAARGATAEPVMTHQAWASFKNDSDAAAFGELLDGVTAGGTPVFAWRRDGARVLFWCEFMRPVAEDLKMQDRSGRSSEFTDFFAPVGYVNNSQHHPEGAFWIKSPGRSHRVELNRLPLEAAARLTMGLLDEQPREQNAA